MSTINSITLRVFESIFGGGGVLERGGLFHFFTQKGGGLLERGAYLRGGLNREITVVMFLSLLLFVRSFYSEQAEKYALEHGGKNRTYDLRNASYAVRSV